MNREVIVGLLCLTGSVLLYSTLGMIQEPRATYFPRTVIIIIGVLSVLQVLQSLLIKKTKKPQGGEPFPWARCLSLFGLIIFYLFVSESVGFYLSSFLFFVVVTFVLGHKSLTLHRAFTRLGASAAFTLILFVLFKVLLEVQTPQGLWF